MFDFSIGETSKTPYGDVKFGDGVQIFLINRLIAYAHIREYIGASARKS